MSNTLRYRVFRLGQIWSVVGDDGVKLGFTTRPGALRAVVTMAHAHRACGEGVELLLQDEVGRLVSVADVTEPLDFSRIPRSSAWDPFPVRPSLRLVDDCDQ